MKAKNAKPAIASVPSEVSNIVLHYPILLLMVGHLSPRLVYSTTAWAQLRLAPWVVTGHSAPLSLLQNNVLVKDRLNHA